VNFDKFFINSIPISLPRQGWVRVEVKFTVEQVTKAQRGNRCRAILFL
jgi:hypothetical protein